MVQILSGLSYYIVIPSFSSFSWIVMSLILGLLLVYFMDMSWIVVGGSCMVLHGAWKERGNLLKAQKMYVSPLDGGLKEWFSVIENIRLRSLKVI